MSIWCSNETIGWEEDGWEDVDGKPIEPTRNGGEVRSYANGWSNHYPTSDDTVEQRAHIDLATIPVWCVPGHDDESDYERVGEWLRLSVSTVEHNWSDPSNIKKTTPVQVDVVMDEAATRLLVEQLSEWLARPKAIVGAAT